MRTLDDVLALHEDTDFEAKAAQGRHGEGNVPKSFWETYSAMANTDGGVILLGATYEVGKGLTVLGIANPEQVRKALWDNLHNRKQISTNLLHHRDIEIVAYEGKKLVWVRVPRATRTQRPIYIGDNPFTGTFRRNYEGDYHCDEATVRRMLAEAVEASRDATVLVGFGLNDLVPESLAAYRNELRSTRLGHPWSALDDRELLRSLGGWGVDRLSRQEGLTVAGILMFGHLRSILDAVPTYLVDYQERTGVDSDVRWIDRLTTDGTWSGNLFDFYRRAYSKISEGLKVPFRLDHGYKRIDETHVHEALREALVNTLIHADYSGTVGILVIKQTHRFFFRNPGGLRLPIPLILAGGTSDCRNRNLQKMFQLIGAGEQAGSGFPRILRAWREQHWRTPLLREDSTPEHTLLQLPMISLLPQEVIDELDRMFGLRFRALEESGRLALATALIEGKVTNERLRELTHAHPRDLTSLFRGLVDGGFLAPVGVGRGTFYQLPWEVRPAHGSLPLLEGLYDNGTPSSEHSSQSSVHLDDSSLHLAPSFEHLSDGPVQVEIEPARLARLNQLAADVRRRGKVPKEVMETTILALCQEDHLTVRELGVLLARSPATLRVHYLNRLVNEDRLMLRYPDKLTHPEQAYRTKPAS